MKYHRILISEEDIFEDEISAADEQEMMDLMQDQKTADFLMDPLYKDGDGIIEGLPKIPGIAEIRVYASTPEVSQIGSGAGVAGLPQPFVNMSGEPTVTMIENDEIPENARLVPFEELPDEVRTQLIETIKDNLPQIVGFHNYTAVYDSEKMKPMKDAFAIFSSNAKQSGAKIKYEIGEGFKTRGDIVLEGEKLVFTNPEDMVRLAESAQAVHFVIDKGEISLDIVFRDIATLQDEHGNIVSEEEIFEKNFANSIDDGGFNLNDEGTLMPCMEPGMFWKIKRNPLSEDIDFKDKVTDHTAANDTFKKSLDSNDEDLQIYMDIFDDVNDSYFDDDDFDDDDFYNEDFFLDDEDCIDDKGYIEDDYIEDDCIEDDCIEDECIDGDCIGDDLKALDMSEMSASERFLNVLMNIVNDIAPDMIDLDEDAIKMIAENGLGEDDFEERISVWKNEMHHIFEDMHDSDMTVDMVSEAHLERLACIYDDLLKFGVDSDDNREIGFEIDTDEDTTSVYSISAAFSWYKEFRRSAFFKISSLADEIRFSIIDDDYKSITIKPEERFIKTEFVFRGLKK